MKNQRPIEAAASPLPSDDTTPPVTDHVLIPPAPGDGGTYERPVTLVFLANDEDGGSGVDFTEYRVNGGDWTEYDPFMPPTVSGDGEINCAPMGVEWDEATIVLKPFLETATYRNVQATGAAVVNLTDDILVFTQAALGDPHPPTRPAVAVDGADPHGLEPVFAGAGPTGYVPSGGYGHALDPAPAPAYPPASRTGAEPPTPAVRPPRGRRPGPQRR